MIKDLIKLAKNLDGIGLHKESDFIDRLIKNATSPAIAAPQVGFYECSHTMVKEYFYYDGETTYDVKMPAAKVFLKLQFSSLSNGTHTRGRTDLKTTLDFKKDKKITDAEFAAAVGLRSGWYKVPSGPYATNYWYVSPAPTYSILGVARNGQTSSVSIFNFFRMMNGNGVVVKDDEYASSPNKKNYDALSKKVDEGSVMGDNIVASKRGKKLQDAAYTYATSEDGLSFSWRHKKSGKTGTFSEKANPDRWVDAVRNLNESRTTEIS